MADLDHFQSPISDGQSPTPHIMVVDDDPNVASLIARYLEREGLPFVVCHHPREALQAKEKGSFGLALVDINLPEMNGLELAALLKENEPDLEIVFITGYGTFDNAIQAIRLGAYDYLRKPIDVTDLMLCLKRFSERWRLREQARENEQRHFQLIQNLPSLIMVITREFHVEFINQASLTMLGYTPEEAVQDPGWFLARIAPVDRERLTTIFALAFRSIAPRFSVECDLLHRAGHRIHAMINSIPLPSKQEGLPAHRIQALAVDITDRVTLERTVVQEERLSILEAVLKEVAHELRNPLVSIGGFARRITTHHPELKDGDIIVSEVQRLEKILQKIMGYLEPVKINPLSISLNRIVMKCVAELSPELEASGVDVRVSQGDGLSDLYGDPELLVRILTRLIRNTAGQAAKGGMIHLKTFESGDHLHLALSAPIPLIQQRDPTWFFVPLDEESSRMGLPLSFRLLKRMGGLLSVVQYGEEMAFTLSFPKEKGRPGSEPNAKGAV